MIRTLKSKPGHRRRSNSEGGDTLTLPLSLLWKKEEGRWFEMKKRTSRGKWKETGVEGLIQSIKNTLYNVPCVNLMRKMNKIKRSTPGGCQHLKKNKTIVEHLLLLPLCILNFFVCRWSDFEFLLKSVRSWYPINFIWSLFIRKYLWSLLFGWR